MDSTGGMPYRGARGRTRAALLLALTAAVCALYAPPAFGAYLHNAVTGEYGKEGPAASGTGSGCRIAWQAETHRIYLFADSKIYALNRTAPGTAVPVGAPFPISVTSSNCGDPDFEVDNSAGASKGNLYAVFSSTGMSGWSAAGSPLAGWPVSNGSGETCGVGVTSSGEVWGNVYNPGSVRKWSAAGVQNGSITTNVNACKIAVDQTNNDLYVAPYNGGPIRKYTAASGYSSFTEIGSGATNPGLAVNGLQHRLYIGTGSSTVKAYNTEDGSLVEEIPLGASGGFGIAVDEATDTLFVTTGEGATGRIKEFKGAIVPDVTVSEPTGLATLHGHVALAGGGEVTECYFEFSTSANFSGASTAPCTPAPNYGSDQDVSADVSGSVTGETLYYYRLVASNANGSNKSSSLSFTPHFVAGLHTDPADQIERTSVRLNASFLGTGEDTHYYFKWGTTTAYGHTTPVEDAGVTSIQTAVSAQLGEVLDPETVYHFKVVAENGKGTSEANDQTFETDPAVTGLTTEAATNIKTATADLNASFTGDNLATTYRYEWGSSTLYGNVTEEGEIANPSGPTQIPPASIAGLQPLHTYHFRVVAENSYGTTYGADQTFTTFTAPVIVALTSSHATATTADLEALINPKGTAAEYQFEYGKTPAYGTTVPIPAGELPATETPEPADVHLTGLDGGVYHFRLVTRNVFGESTSQDQTFNFYPPVCPNATVRQQTGSNSLPDCRAYELVTPEDQGVTIIFPSVNPYSATATRPSKVIYTGAFGLVPGAGDAVNNSGDTYVATRTASGWQNRYVGLPSTFTSRPGGPPWNPPKNEADKANEGVLSDTNLSRLVDWDGGYFKPGELFASPEHAGSSNAPYIWDTTSGKQVDRWPTNVHSIPGGEHFVGRTAASADLSHFIFSSNIPFAIGGVYGDVYDNDTVHDTVQIISRDEMGEPIANAVPLDQSTDGSHILMIVRGGSGTSIPKTGPGQLYLSVDDGLSYAIAPGKTLTYVGMKPDGTEIYFTSAEKLTEEDQDTSLDLYMWSEESEAPGHLTLVSKANEPGAGNTDSCSASWTTKCGIKAIPFKKYSEQQGGLGGSPFGNNVVAPNGDVYFLSPERLAGDNGVDGQENLYYSHGGKLHFVAALDPAGIPCTENQSTKCAETAIGRLETNADNSYMVFLTASRVTGYDNAGKSEIYRFDTAKEETVCVSCVPTGAAPVSNVYSSHNGRFMTEDGRVFFDTADALVPQDTNEASDVYEYVDGRPQLITSGTNVGNDAFGISNFGSPPGLIGVSADGTDVYFATYDVLVGQDRNGEAVKIYDARSGGGFQFTPPPPPCVAADECHGPSSEAPAPTLNGTGADLGTAGNVHETKKSRKAKRHKKRHKSHKRRNGGGRMKHRTSARQGGGRHDR